MRLTVPDFSLILLVGVSGCGKSTFARRCFRPTEVLSSDFFRGLVSDDENDQSATVAAFDALRYVAGKRLAGRRLTVIDATNVQREARKPLIELARRYHCLPVAIVLDLDPDLCIARNRDRADRDLRPYVVRNQAAQIRRSLRSLRREGFRHVHVLSSPADVEAAEIERQPLWTDRRGEHGPFDVIGDVHGCFDELSALLAELGWQVERQPGTADGGDEPRYRLSHAEGRKLVFLGDLVDRGPKVPETLRLAMDAVAAGQALAVPGNHDVKLLKALQGKAVKVTHGLDRSLAQLGAESEELRRRVVAFLDGLVSHYVLDDGRLVVAHAGMREDMQGRASAAARAFALYGETSGESDELGLPVRHDWARDYRGAATVVYGHTPVAEPEWVQGTINVDTGCVFGGRLSALRYPEKEIVSVPAARVYAEPVRPLAPSAAKPADDDLLDVADVLGKRIVHTRLRGNLTVREENATAALEAMSRFAADPRWLIYLPPTMAPSETSHRDGFLERPEEAFDQYAKLGVPTLICEEKHMGSRAVVVVCRDAAAARRRFGVTHGDGGACLTRTGRRFFTADAALETQLLATVRGAATAAGLWDELATDWLCLDCELMPWSLKAGELLRRQYAPVGAAATASLDAAVALVEGADNPALELPALCDLGDDLRRRAGLVAGYVDAYRRYCWPVASLSDVRLAPFHLLASEGAVHDDRDHRWHMAMAARLAAGGDGVVVATAHREVDLESAQSRATAVAWWEELTAAGGEGMVVKPLDFLARGRKGLAQPALKCRGREYLRIIYGPEYTRERHLGRLRRRNAGRKRSLALRELALGLEALHRFVAGEPLRRVHECVFAVLALESEPVDPRL